MDSLAAARSCAAEPGCTGYDVPDGLVTDPATGQPLVSVHVKGAMDVGPLLDWVAVEPGVQADSKVVHVFDQVGFEVDLSMDLVDEEPWAGLRGALVQLEGYVGLVGVPELASGAHPDFGLAVADAAACGGDQECLQGLGPAWPWLDTELGSGAILLDVPHDGEPGLHDGIASELESLAWVEPPWVFAVDHDDGRHRTRVQGRLASAELTGLQGWLNARAWAAWSRPMTEDELSEVRLRLPVAEAAADLAACGADELCHYQAGQAHQAVASPAGRLGVVFLGEVPDIEGLNGLEYPGWSMAPPGYFMHGAAGLLSFEALRGVGLGRWQLDEALSLELDENPDALQLTFEQWQGAWGPDDEPISWPFLPDQDGDGSPDSQDCDDFDEHVYPGADEINDCKDSDCDGYLPSAEVADADGDGARACEDCDDFDASRSPWLPELCDGVDNDCSGLVGPDEFDNDQDGLRPCDGDCDDWEPTVYPGAPELCDGLDNDCNGVADYSPDENFDLDGDGWIGCADCDDWNPMLNPGMPEICNGVDDNCDGIMLIGPPGELTDADADFWPACNDCDDTDPDVNPGASDWSPPGDCDGVDTDCDGTLNPMEVDGDGDGQTECDGDCDDSNGGVHPEAAEVCDGVDNNCDGNTDHFWSFDGQAGAWTVNADHSAATLRTSGTAEIREHPSISGLEVAELNTIGVEFDASSSAQPNGAGTLMLTDREVSYDTPFCATFDFRIVRPQSDISEDCGHSGHPDASDGFTFAIFDEDVAEAAIFDSDWLDEGGWGGGHLGAFGYSDTVGTNTDLGYVVEFDYVVNGGFGDVGISSPHPAFSDVGTETSNPFTRLHHFFPDFLDPWDGSNANLFFENSLVAPCDAVRVADQSDPPTEDEEKGWYTATISWGEWVDVDGVDVPIAIPSQSPLAVHLQAPEHLDLPNGDPLVATDSVVGEMLGLSDGDGYLRLGFTAGKGTGGDQSVEIDSFALICEPCWVRDP